MNPKTRENILDLMDSCFTSAALGAAMELGLFWLLEERPRSAEDVARALKIPKNRCHYWLQLLAGTGLVEKTSGVFAPSAAARSAILDEYSRESWVLLAQEARERIPAILDLPGSLPEPGSVWEARGLEPPDYKDRMSENPERARRFTRMLYEIHGPLANALAGSLDMNGVNRMMDLGGGSGVVSLALLHRYSGLTAVVVDIENVCAAGREIVGSHAAAADAGSHPAAEIAAMKRITYHAADFLRDELPSGFDMVLECDVNVYGEALFRRIRNSINPGGRLVVVDHFAPAEGVAPPSRLHWAFQKSMARPDFAYPTVSEVRTEMERAGFRIMPKDIYSLAVDKTARFLDGITVIVAYK